MLSNSNIRCKSKSALFIHLFHHSQITVLYPNCSLVERHYIAFSYCNASTFYKAATSLTQWCAESTSQELSQKLDFVTLDIACGLISLYSNNDLFVLFVSLSLEGITLMVVVILLILTVSGAFGVATFMKIHKGNLQKQINDMWWKINYEDIIIFNDNKVNCVLLNTGIFYLYFQKDCLGNTN